MGQAGTDIIMVKPEQFEIILGNPHKVYRAGETVTGSLILHLNQPQLHASLHLKFSGKAQVSFTRGSGRRKQHHQAKESYLKKEVRLLPREGCSSGASSQIEQGHHEFPFIFDLLGRIPSSFESFSGSVRYHVKARLEVGWKDSISVQQYFVVFQPYDLNDSGLVRNPVEHELGKTLCCLCCGSGILSARVSIPRQGFVPGETIPIQADVSNNTISRVCKMYFTIEEVSYCHALRETEAACKTLKTFTPPAEHSGIAAGSSDTWVGRDMIMVPVAVPTGLSGCNIIDVKHRLVLNVILAGPSCSLKVPVDIVIGTVPLASDQYNTDDAVVSQPNFDSGYSNSGESLPASRGRGSPDSNEIMGIQPPAYSPFMISQGAVPSRRVHTNTCHALNTQPTRGSSHAVSEAQQETPM